MGAPMKGFSHERGWAWRCLRDVDGGLGPWARRCCHRLALSFARANAVGVPVVHNRPAWRVGFRLLCLLEQALSRGLSRWPGATKSEKFNHQVTPVYREAGI